MIPLLTERLILRALEPSDFPDFLALGNNINIARWMEHMPHPLTQVHVSAYEEQTRGQAYAFVDRKSEAFVGTLSYKVEDQTAHLGYWIGEPFWNQGFANEALQTIIADLFLNRDFQALAAKVDPNNQGSIRLLERLGFTEIGTATCSPVTQSADIEAKLFSLNRARFDALYVKAGCALPFPVKQLDTVLVSAVALIDADGRILLAQRPTGKAMAGLWEFPGGKIEEGETPEAALKRELKEELGISTEMSCFAPLTFASHSYPDFHLLMTVFACRTFEGQPSSREGQNLKWVPISRLRDYPMPEADVPLVALIQDYL